VKFIQTNVHLPLLIVFKIYYLGKEFLAKQQTTIERLPYALYYYKLKQIKHKVQQTQ